jgi:hypothetical protein
MKYAIEMGWDGMILVHISGLLEFGSAVQKSMKGDTQHADGISLLSFFQNKRNRQLYMNLQHFLDQRRSFCMMPIQLHLRPIVITYFFKVRLNVNLTAFSVFQVAVSNVSPPKFCTHSKFYRN